MQANNVLVNQGCSEGRPVVRTRFGINALGFGGGDLW